jgi:hypothetical protein
MTDYQKDLLSTVSGPDGYGDALAAWKGQKEIQRPVAGVTLGPLPAAMASAFVDETYVLVKLRRYVTVYRGYETANLKAPLGVDHPSFYLGLLSSRFPGKPDGMWWSPARPSLSIDNLGLSSLHRADDRDRLAIKLEWNRLDFYIEGRLAPGTLVYAGRTAPQQDVAAYGGNRYGGAAMQFRLTAPSAQVVQHITTYKAS